MPRVLLRIHISILAICFTISIVAQDISTACFMENVPTRHTLNPAFQPLEHLYISLPIVGLSQMNIGNNSIALNDIFYKQNGRLDWFFNTQNPSPQFYDALKLTTLVHANLQTNLISVGYKKKNCFWSFSLTEKVDGKVSIPKEFILLSFYTAPQLIDNSFNLSNLQADFTSYSEAAFGYATRLNDYWSVGAKMKFLYGRANISINNKNISSYLGKDQWEFDVNGVANMSSPTKLGISDNFATITANNPTNVFGWLKPSGAGVGMDIGVDFRATKNINLVASITDLGFLSWHKNTLNVDYSFQQSLSNGNYSIVEDQILVNKSLRDSILISINKGKITNKNYSTYTTSMLYLGAEYTLSNNYLSFGLLSKIFTFKRTFSQEITFSINAKPNNWLNSTLSYSVLKSRYRAFGAGLSLKSGSIRWFIAADYIPFYSSTLLLSKFGQKKPPINLPIPYKTESYNMAGGITLVFNEPKRNLGLIAKKKKSSIKKNFFQPRSRNTFKLNWQNQKSGLIY